MRRTATYPSTRVRVGVCATRTWAPHMKNALLSGAGRRMAQLVVSLPFVKSAIKSVLLVTGERCTMKKVGAGAGAN